MSSANLKADGEYMTTENYVLPEEIEGFGDDPDDSWVDYPLDEVLIRHDVCQVQDAVRRIERGQFKMNPDFQRDFIWDESQQSKLIESVMMRIPLPVFYLAEDPEGRKVVVDGLQRLTTFYRFLNGDLRLRLPERPELNGKTFGDLIPKLQVRVEDCNLIFYIIDEKAPEQTRLDIFERVNSGETLTRQQMRNCLYMGPSTLFLRERSRTDLFIEATGGSLRTKIMRDREFVNRFCAFQILDLKDYKDMDGFLRLSLTEINADTGLLAPLSDELDTALCNNLVLFGRHAFRKHQPGQVDRNVINASLWDVMSTGLSRYPKRIVDDRADDLRGGIYGLLADTGFNYAITYATNDVKQVLKRFEMAESMIKGVLDAD